jgi:hypothetical protein
MNDLIDVSETAKSAGLNYTVFVTEEVWDKFIVPDERSRKHGQSESGRLMDMLSRFKKDAKGPNTSIFGAWDYRVSFVTKEKQKRIIPLRGFCEARENGQPAITIGYFAD